MGPRAWGGLGEGDGSAPGMPTSQVVSNLEVQWDCLASPVCFLVFWVPLEAPIEGPAKEKGTSLALGTHYKVDGSILGALGGGSVAPGGENGFVGSTKSLYNGSWPPKGAVQ